MLLEKSRLAIIGAMDEEIQAFLDLMSDVSAEKIHHVDFYLGTLAKHDVVLVKSGIGITMAAMTTTMLLNHFKISALINIGTAGGLSDQLKVLDVVVCDRITYHDLDLQAFGHPRSFSKENRYVYYADPKLLQHFKTLNVPFHQGALVSGHQFIHTPDQIDTIRSYFKEAIAVEMEGAAIAHIASEFKIPFLLIRSISDLVHAPKNEMSFDAYLKKASRKSAKITAQLIEDL